MSAIDTTRAEQFRNFAYWRQFLTVENLKTNPPIVRYQPHGMQQRLGQALVAADREGRPFRAIVLKSRRMGSSTFFQGRMVHRACTRNHFKGLTVAHDAETASYLFGMAEGMWERLPPHVRVAKEAGNQGKRLSLVNGSELRSTTAGNRDSGRGTAQRAVHCSEVAFWGDDARKVLLSLQQIVVDEPGTIFVEESTAQGVGNAFHQDWLRAQNGDSEFIPFFAPWFEFEDYVIKGGGKNVKILDDREEALVERGVTRDQLAWRRWAIENRAGGDSRLFDQEYPDSPEVAFLTTGRPYFTLVDRLRPSPPWRRGNLFGLPVRGGGKLEFKDDEFGALSVWEAPRKGRRYVIFADVAGLASGREWESRPSGLQEDASCAQVIDLESGVQVACWHGRVDGDEYGLELARLGWFYAARDGSSAQPALIAVENTGGWGNLPITILDKQFLYPNLYRRRALDTYERDESSHIGWATTMLSRPLMLEALKTVVRDHPGWVRDPATVDEMRSFVVQSNRRPAAQSGCHDDRVMALAGAHAVRLEEFSTPVRVEVAVRPPQVRSFVRMAPRAKR